MSDDNATQPGPDHAAPEDSAEKAEKAKSLAAVAKDDSIVHAPELIGGGPSAVKTGRYLSEAKPDGAEIDEPKRGAVVDSDVFVELLDNSATPRYRQVASKGLPYYSPLG